MPENYVDAIATEWLAPLSRTPVMQFFDEADGFTLFIIIFVGYFVSQHFCRDSLQQTSAKRLSAIVFGLYFAYAYFFRFTDPDTGTLLWILLRSFLVGGLSVAFFQLLLPLIAYVTIHPYRWFQFQRARLRYALQQRRERREERRQEELKRQALANMPQPLPAAEYRRRAVEDARREYEQVKELLKQSGLDRHERRRVLLHARQKFVARMKDVV